MGNRIDADLKTILKLMEETETGPFFKAVLDLLRSVTMTHRPDADDNCWADGCRDYHEEFMTAFPCRHWLDAQRVAVAWLYGRTVDSLAEEEDPKRVAARERKARQREREREAGSPVQANGNPSVNPSPKGSGKPSGKGAGNPSRNQVTTTSPEDPFSEKSQVGELRHAGQARDVPGDNLSETLRTSTNLSETSAGLA